MKKVETYMNLISMIRELDLEKNDIDTIKNVLNIIADELEDFAPIIYKNGE